jgi:hypothetical protein
VVDQVVLVPARDDETEEKEEEEEEEEENRNGACTVCTAAQETSGERVVNKWREGPKSRIGSVSGGNE